jgi:hypothetical protein
MTTPYTEGGSKKTSCRVRACPTRAHHAASFITAADQLAYRPEERVARSSSVDLSPIGFILAELLDRCAVVGFRAIEPVVAPLLLFHGGGDQRGQ